MIFDHAFPVLAQGVEPGSGQHACLPPSSPVQFAIVPGLVGKGGKGGIKAKILELGGGGQSGTEDGERMTGKGGVAGGGGGRGGVGRGSHALNIYK